LRLIAAHGRVVVDLAEFDFAVACEVHELLGEVDGFLLRLDVDESEAADELFGFGEGAVGDFEVSVGPANTGAECAGEAALGGEEDAGLE
jgi:hypothetical protein